ncbi:hypothetical protein [Methanosarcina horonobensis]|uniref:hypothetical protein n=1 Tax=Methanosarcina horonobensis TaxID=418008 RepID=UPI00064FB568|nr:hypothetical protein [Methanosarcina horonobensis]
MRYKKFEQIKKTIAILLVICFALSTISTSASAADNSKGYSDGYNKGYDDGKDDGKKQGEKDCKQYGSRENLDKIPTPPNKDSWTESYKNSYNKGYQKGYIDGYNANRYTCLK